MPRWWPSDQVAITTAGDGSASQHTRLSTTTTAPSNFYPTQPLTRLMWVRVKSNLTHDSRVEHSPGRIMNAEIGVPRHGSWEDHEMLKRNDKYHSIADDMPNPKMQFYQNRSMAFFKNCTFVSDTIFFSLTIWLSHLFTRRQFFFQVPLDSWHGRNNIQQKINTQ